MLLSVIFAPLAEYTVIPANKNKKSEFSQNLILQAKFSVDCAKTAIDKSNSNKVV